MRRWWLLLLCLMLLQTGRPLPVRGEDPPMVPAPESLSEEDRQVVEMLDLLEMLELLNDLEDVAAVEDAQ